MMRVLLDTDVVLDYLLGRQPFAQAAAVIWKAAENKNFEAFISVITPVNVYYIARKLKGDQQARLLVSGLLDVCEIALTNRNDLKRALTLPISDYEDAVQAAGAYAMDLDAIVTRNVGDNVDITLRIFSPEDFVAMLKMNIEF
jgi:predicted nucleic acid-binding protein